MEGVEPEPRWLNLGGEIDLPAGSTRLDEAAIRQVREHLISAARTQHPDMTTEDVLLLVDKALSQIVGWLDYDLAVDGGFCDGEDHAVLASGRIDRGEPE